MNEPSRELALWLFLDELRTYLRSIREPQKAFALALRRTCDHFKVNEACVATLNPDSPRAEIAFAIPRGARWDLELLATFLKQQRVDFPSNLIVAPIQRRGRLSAVLALRGDGFKHPLDHLALRRIARLISESIELIDRRRTMEVRAQIDRKILEQLRPQDLFYQVLHGLRSLTQYDHSSALLISDPNKNEIELVAEQVAWRKGKSNRIGLKLPVNDELRRDLQKDWVYGFDRQSDGWKEWSGGRSNALAELLDYNLGEGGFPSDTRESAMLCAPFATREGVFGLLKVAARHPGMFATYEASLVRRFVPLAAVAIQNLQRSVTLQSKWVEAERKHVAANLLSGVSHDVNNALGSVLPLVQQLLIDIRSDGLPASTLSEDLEQIEKSIQTCRRIFGGLLALARNANQNGAQGNLRRALDSTLAVLRDRLDRQGIRLEIQLGDIVPNIQVGQADLERVLLNLATNAGEAMPNGGLLSIKAEHVGNRLAVMITDTGAGITPENLTRIEEPFFTTKHNGTGLGLSVCRSILRNAGGHLYICSEPGSTQVRVLLPVVAERALPHE